MVALLLRVTRMKRSASIWTTFKLRSANLTIRTGSATYSIYWNHCLTTKHTIQTSFHGLILNHPIRLVRVAQCCGYDGGCDCGSLVIAEAHVTHTHTHTRTHTHTHTTTTTTTQQHRVLSGRKRPRRGATILSSFCTFPECQGLTPH